MKNTILITSIIIMILWGSMALLGHTNNSLYKEVQDLLFYKTLPGDIVWSSPAIFLEIKNIFKQMQKQQN